MKTVTRTGILILCGSFLLAGSPLLAEMPRPDRDPVGEALFPPELIMRHQNALGLEEGQKIYIRAQLSTAQGRFLELQWQLQDSMEALISLLGRNAVDEQEVLEQLEKVLSSEREIKRAQITLMVRIKNKLTPEQQARLRDLRGLPGGE